MPACAWRQPRVPVDDLGVVRRSGPPSLYTMTSDSATVSPRRGKLATKPTIRRIFRGVSTALRQRQPTDQLTKGIPVDAQLDSLAGQVIVFTGRLSEVRRDAVAKATRAGASVREDVTSHTTVVVQGSMSPTYKYGDIGVKLDAAHQRRRRGQDIYIIDEDEFRALLDGRRLSNQTKRAAVNKQVRPDPLWMSFRPDPPRRLSRSEGAARGHAIHEIDLDELERRTREHQQLISSISAATRKHGYEPLRSVGTACQFDIGWIDGGGVLNVVEAKTTRAASERQQMRLGLGQVLDYREFVVRYSSRPVRAHLVLSRKPAQKFEHILQACLSVGVNVVSASEIGRLFDA
jgi:hypothetical protein